MNQVPFFFKKLAGRYFHFFLLGNLFLAGELPGEIQKVQQVVVIDSTLAGYMKGFGLSGADADGTADPDGDGVNNNAEMAFGTDPSNGAGHVTTLVRGTDTIKLLYTQRNSGVSYTVKSFTDLSTPFDSGGTLVTPTLTNPQPGDIRYGYTQYEASLSTGPSNRGFLRVKAVLAAAPVAGAATQSSPDNATGVVTGSASFTDPEGWSLTFSATGTSAGGGTVSVDPVTGAFTYTPTQAQRQTATSNTTDTFTITASNGANSTDQTITVAVAVPPTATQLKHAGFSATELKTAGFTATDLKDAGFSGAELKTAGYTAADLKTAGFTASQLKATGFSGTELKDAGFTASELKATGFSGTDLKTAGFSAADLKSAGFSATDLKSAGFSATDLKAAGFTASQLKATGFSGTDLKTAGFSADDLKSAGFSATELKTAGFTAVEAAAAGYTSDELIAAGYEV